MSTPTEAPARAPSLPLRERKRRETMAAIEDAATALVADAGYESVTVDDICDRAGVSRRTFFNYVPSKEAAVVGAPPSSVPPELVDRYLDEAAHDPVSASLGLVLAVVDSHRVGDAAHSSAVSRRRKAIFRDDPALAAARVSAFAPLHRLLAEHVEVALTTHPGARRLADLRSSPF